MSRALLIAALLGWVLPAPPGALADDLFPQVKIDRVDLSDFPRLRVYASFLDRQLRPVSLDRLADVEVLVRRGRERPEPLIHFVKGVSAEQEDATLLARSKAARPLGLMVVAPGTAMSPLGLPAVDANLRKAVAGIFDGLAETDLANVLWYGDHIYMYVPTSGKTGELSNLTDRYDACAQLRTRVEEEADDVPPPTPGGTLEDLGEEACGLVSSHPELPGIIEKMQNFGGYHPTLFGVRHFLPGVTPEHPRQELPGIQGARPAPAFEEALKILVRQGGGVEQRLLILVSDGRDGYLLAEDDARLRFRSKDCKGDGEGKKARVRRERDACVNQRLHQYIGAEQKRFAEETRRWLALARAAGIRIHAVSFESGVADRSFELERLELLAIESGGTYRRARGPGMLYEEVTNLADEVAEQIVIDFESGLVEGEEVSLRLRVKVDGGNAFVSDDALVRTPVLDHSPAGAVSDGLIWLQETVGYVWYVVILVVLGIIGAILFWKLGKKGMKGLGKKAGGLKKKIA